MPVAEYLMQPDEFSDALTLLVADAAWAVVRDGDTRQAADVVAVLERWPEHPLVSRAAALVTATATFARSELEPLHRALVRAARVAWRADPNQSDLVEVLRYRAALEHEGDRGLLAAELLTAAIELCDEPAAQGQSGAQPLLADLLCELLEMLSETGTRGTAEHAEVMAWGANVGHRCIDLLGELVQTDRARYLRRLAGAHMAAADFVAWLDGEAAGADQSRRGVRLYEELAESAGSAVLSSLDRAWAKHIALLERVGDESEVTKWERHRIERLRAMAATAVDAASPNELSRLIWLLRAHELHTEAVAVSARVVELAETTAADGNESAVRRLARTMLRHGEHLHRAGRRAEAVRIWYRFLETRQRLHSGSARGIEEMAGAYHEIVTVAQELGDISAAVEFGNGAVGVWSLLSERDPAQLESLVDELRAQADRLHKAGRSAEASDAAERALTHTRDLVSMDSQRYRPDLSWTLTCATRMHLRSWRIQQADLRSGQAVELIEQLAHDDPGRYTGDLANALNNRAMVLNRCEDYEQARVVSARSVALYEEMTTNGADRPAALANALCTRAITLRELRVFDAALECAVRAEEIYARLADKDPATYSADLAYAVNKLASVHEDMGNTEAVRAAATRVLEICATLAEGPARAAQRAWALHVLVQNLSRTGRPAEALTYSTPLLEHRERMAAQDPAAGEPQLAIALGNHSVCLSEIGRPRPALEYARRAVDLWRRLSESEPRPHRGRLADALDSYATRLMEARQFEQAVDVSAEAVERYEELLADHQDLYLQSAAMCLDNHALRLGEVGRDEDALATATRSLAIFEELVTLDDDAYCAGLGMSLINYAVRLNSLDRGAEAVEYTTRAVALFEKLRTAAIGADARGLVWALDNHSYSLVCVGRADEAVLFQERAVRIAAAQAADDCPSSARLLAEATRSFANRLVDAGQWPRAREHSRIAVRLWEELAASDSELHLPDLAAALDDHARFCGDQNEWAEAAGYAERAAAAFEELTSRDALRYRPRWALAVEYHAVTRRWLGERGCASAEVDRALSIRRDAAAECPEENIPKLADSEGWAARLRLHISEPDLASAHQERSVVLYTELIDKGHDDLLPGLISVLHRYATSLCETGYRGQAPGAIEEAVRLIRQQVETDRAAHRFRLAVVLRDQSWLLAEAGQRDAAVAAGRSALSLIEQIARAGDGDRRWYLADYRDSLAWSLAELGCRTEALDYTDQAVALWEQLAAENAEPSLDLAWSLWHRARWRAELDDGDSTALPDSWRAVEIYQQVYGDRPSCGEFLAGALVDHARHLARAGHHAEALELSSRALELWERLAQDKPQVHRPGLADCLRWHATHLVRLSEHDVAVACARRAVRLAEEAAERTRPRYLPDLAAICREIALLLRDRDPREARTLAERSVSLYTELADEEPEVFGSRLSEARETIGQFLGSNRNPN
ncbi:tetratricopeptide repeat protein [Nocardia pneumoniae]|uniref:tetratricopeptide repeat protein n=1 Tax=Nocardia pneumoniae TaxID=228601 RepID=UPI0012F66657|nr:tetratricopeptide repeat protein [Nocardia pneumoniae]